MDTETITVKLDGKYEGWTAEMDADPEVSVMIAFQSGQFVGILGGLASVLRGWNFTNRAGKPAPPTYDGLASLRLSALNALAQAYGEHFGSGLPNG